jgi:mannose-6-phosphate isomerase-like protein (cupin superfamily)
MTGKECMERGQKMQELLDAVRAAFGGMPVAGPFLAEWPNAEVSRVREPAQLPVCRWLEGMGDDGVMGVVKRAAAGLVWQQTYGAEAFGGAFLEGYGWSEFVGLRGPVASDRIACGVLVLGPGITYPAHAHEAEEIYLPISGVAHWQRGDGAFEPVPVGQVVHHPSWMPHAMEVGAEPLAALYLWRGGDLAAKSVILGRQSAVR